MLNKFIILVISSGNFNIIILNIKMRYYVSYFYDDISQCCIANAFDTENESKEYIINQIKTSFIVSQNNMVEEFKKIKDYNKIIELWDENCYYEMERWEIQYF